MNGCPGLLVSVRSAEEAEAALAGGADLIDVKEPSRGSLGRADDEIIAAVIRAVAGRRPVSAALGDVGENPKLVYLSGLAYGKWGFAGCARLPEADWGRQFMLALDSFAGIVPSFPFAAVAAYADWERAAAPPPAAVLEIARKCECGVFLLDTFGKDGSTLLDWMPVQQIASLRNLCRKGGIRVALAGSLGPSEIEALRDIAPDWIAVRGAVCSGGREGTVDVERVRALAGLVHNGTV
jgi:(5-formylfuran-3-yl)methyl phosphate synthase